MYGRFLKMLVGFFGRSDSKICDTGVTGYILGVLLVFLFFDMAIKKTLVVALAIVFALPPASFAAFETGALQVDINEAIQRLIAKYEARIAELEVENAELKKKLSGLAPGTVVTVETSTGTSTAPQVSQTPKPATNSSSATANTGSSIVATGNAEFDALVKSVNASFSSILKENGLPETAQLGLFEFVIGKKAFFISIDDGKNPSGVTAFKTKILFSYDDSLKMTVTGKFNLNYDVQRYVTTFGGNPYAGATRIRVKNPSYTGKLLEEVTGTSATSSTTSPATSGASTTSSATSSTTSTSQTVSIEVTTKDVRAAYDKNKLAEAIKLANTYLAKNPRDIEILTVRYRSLYITGKYVDSLKDIATIESIQGAKFDCTIAKDASFIAKSAKDTAAATRYANYVANCKK